MGSALAEPCARSIIHESLSSVFCTQHRTDGTRERAAAIEQAGKRHRVQTLAATHTFGSKPCSGGTGVPDQNVSSCFCSENPTQPQSSKP